MSNKMRLSNFYMIVVVAIMISLASSYTQSLGLLSLLIPVPYAILGTIGDKKNNLFALIITFIVLMVATQPIYAVNICIMSAIPGIIIGIIAKDIKEDNKFSPVYGGSIAFVLANIALVIILKTVFKVDVFEQFIEISKENLDAQLNMMRSMDETILQGLNTNEILDYIRNLMPTILFFQGILSAFITYYVEVLILRRIKISNIYMPRFTDFYLPGNAISTTFMIYLGILLVDVLEVGLYTDLILMNLQLIFSFMFVIQGISVGVYYFRKWKKEGFKKMFLFTTVALFLSGFMGISFVGMLDSIVDFRKVRDCKST